jgi:hypothetical protein
VGRAVTALVLAAIAIGVGSDSARTEGPAPAKTLLQLRSMPAAFGSNGGKLAWIGDRVVVADMDSGKRIVLGRGGDGTELPVAVAGSTVLWLETVGGNVRIDALRAAAPGRQRRFGSWGDDDYYLGSGPRLGGLASDGKTLAYAIYRLTSLEQKSDACYERGICHWKVTGGGTFVVSPGSLARRRILRPATAVAVEGGIAAAATLKPGARYTGRAQIVLVNLTNGSRRLIGSPLPVVQLTFHGDRLAALITGRRGPSVRVWNLRTRELVSTRRLPRDIKIDQFGLARGKLVFLAFIPGHEVVMSVDVRTGRRETIAQVRSNPASGPWIWHGRVIWVERPYAPHPHALVRSARLP